MSDKVFDLKLIKDNTGRYDIGFDSNGELLLDKSLDSTIISRILTNGDWVGNLFIEEKDRYFRITPTQLDPNKNTFNAINENVKHALQDLINSNYIDNVAIDSNLNQDNNLVININYFSDQKKYSLSFSIWSKSEWQ